MGNAIVMFRKTVCVALGQQMAGAPLIDPCTTTAPEFGRTFHGWAIAAPWALRWDGIRWPRLRTRRPCRAFCLTFSFKKARSRPRWIPKKFRQYGVEYKPDEVFGRPVDCAARAPLQLESESSPQE